jgi:hypothetical protein
MIRHRGTIRTKLYVYAREIATRINEDAKLNEVFGVSASQDVIAQLERAAAALRRWHQRFQWHAALNREIEALASAIAQTFDLATREMLLDQGRARNVGA